MSVIQFVDDPVLIELDFLLVLFVVSLVFVVVDGEQAFVQVFLRAELLSYLISLLLMYLAISSGNVL